MPATRSPARSYCVGVVDDDENPCRSFARLLRAAGYAPATYPSAEVFLADTSRPQFDYLVLGVQSPGMSVLDLQRQLQAEGVATPIIFITAYDDPDAREQGRMAGCAACLRKAYPASGVLEAIRRVVDPRSPPP
jgi:FixJ family two-component response regulator